MHALFQHRPHAQVRSWNWKPPSTNPGDWLVYWAAPLERLGVMCLAQGQKESQSDYLFYFFLRFGCSSHSKDTNGQLMCTYVLSLLSYFLFYKYFYYVLYIYSELLFNFCTFYSLVYIFVVSSLFFRSSSIIILSSFPRRKCIDLLLSEHCQRSLIISVF